MDLGLTKVSPWDQVTPHPRPPVTFEGTLEALRSGRVSIAACQRSPGVIESGIVPENVIWHSGIQFEGFADLHFSKMLIELG